MGVIDCTRTGCGNIMCDYYTMDGNAMCWECYGEFSEKYKFSLLSEGKFKKKLRKFMDTPRKVSKNIDEPNGISVDDFLKENVRTRFN